jgi:hypothetical protein
MMETRHGVTALLDALGVSTYRTDECKEFIENRDRLLKFIEQFSNRLSSDEKYGPLEVYTFGDTLLLTCEIPQPVGVRLVTVGRLLRHILLKSLDELHILWRGAMSVGEHVKSTKSNTLIGPAVADAAAWYEQANWFGVMTTPSCSLWVKRLFEEMSGSVKLTKELSETFVDYDVPLKGGNTLRVPAIGWPFELQTKPTHVSASGNIITPFAELYRMLSRFPIPTRTEGKYFNGLEFFKYCHEQANRRQRHEPQPVVQDDQ